MSDERLRQLERRFRETGAREDYLAWLRESIRCGALPDYKMYKPKGELLEDQLEHFCANCPAGQPRSDGKPRLFTIAETVDVLVQKFHTGRAPLWFHQSLMTSSTLLMDRQVRKWKFVEDAASFFGYSERVAYQEYPAPSRDVDGFDGVWVKSEDFKESELLKELIPTSAIRQEYLRILCEQFNVKKMHIANVRPSDLAIFPAAIMPVLGRGERHSSISVGGPGRYCFVARYA